MQKIMWAVVDKWFVPSVYIGQFGWNSGLNRVVIVKLFDYNPFKKDKNSRGLTTALIVTLVEKALNNNVELKTLVMVIGTIIKQEESKEIDNYSTHTETKGEHN